MTVKYIVQMHFDTAAEMNYSISPWRQKKCSDHQSWWDHRIQIFKDYVLPSLDAQTFQDFDLWGFFNVRDNARSDAMRRIFECDLRGHLSFDGAKGIREHYYESGNDDNWICIILHDSDDLYSAEAFALIAEQTPTPGLAVYFEDGYNYSILDECLKEFKTSDGAGPGPWLARWYPNSALISEEAWWRYRFKWKFHLYHHQIRGCPSSRPMPANHFLGLIHEANTERAWTNPPTERKLKSEITGSVLIHEILRRFGIDG